MKTGQTNKPLVCTHCGAEIKGAAFIEKENGLYLGGECYFRDTYLDGIVDRIEAAYLAMIEAFVTAIDAREHETGNHSLRVSRFAVILGYRFGMRERDLVDLYCGALLHDIGKIGVPDAILLKQGPLNAEEEKIMHEHPETGYRIIGHIGYLKNASEIIHAHHEHFDGSGYPLGLRGDNIPPGARVFSVADALDALTVERTYRKALPFEEAVAEIEKESGSVFDPAVVCILDAALDELRSFVGKQPTFNLPPG
jgi:putative nucleotidyltransferase with HDIG domain